MEHPVLSVAELGRALARRRGSVVTILAFVGIVAIAIVVEGRAIGAAKRTGGTGDHADSVWYDNGRLAQVRGFVRGRESGVHRGWWPDGRFKFVYTYHDGLLEGISREWFPSGALWREQRYEGGHERGLQRMYWEDGRVRASYVVRDGRRYGLMGSKGCVTKDDGLRKVTP